MVAVRNLHKKLPKIPVKKIPASLIYEVINGKPIYYKGYKEVLNGTKKVVKLWEQVHFRIQLLNTF
jgi:hypothetical protein